MDCVVSGRSGKGGLLVMVDRHSRYTLLRRLPSFSQKAVLHALRAMVREGAMMLRGAKEKEESKKRKGNSSQYFSNGSISSLSSLKVGSRPNFRMSFLRTGLCLIKRMSLLDKTMAVWKQTPRTSMAPQRCLRRSFRKVLASIWQIRAWET